MYAFNVYLFLRDRVRVGGGAERGEDTESEAGSRLWAVSTEPDVGLELTKCEIMTWVEANRLTDWATQAPPLKHFVTPTLHPTTTTTPSHHIPGLKSLKWESEFCRSWQIHLNRVLWDSTSCTFLCLSFLIYKTVLIIHPLGSCKNKLICINA